MTSETSFKKIATIGKKTIYYAALAAIASGLGSFNLWHDASCWAGQTVNVPIGTNLQTLVNQYPEEPRSPWRPESTAFSLLSPKPAMRSWDRPERFLAAPRY